MKRVHPKHLWRVLQGRLAAGTMAPPAILADPAAGPEPSLEHPVSQACTAGQFASPRYAAWCAAIGEAPRTHRKQWEFCYILEVLHQADMLAPGRRGLGFGVGEEPLAAYFAARGCTVVATDLGAAEAERAGWVDTGQHAAEKAALNGRGLCPAEAFAERVSFRVVDMNAIPPDLAGFDFTWSACSLEHVGSIAKGLAFIENSLATLRPGGLAVHTTEFNCSSNGRTLDNAGTVLFRRRDFEGLARRLRTQGHRLAFNFHLGDQPLDRHIDVPPFSADKHLKLRLDRYLTTSFGLIVQRAEDGAGD